MLKELPKVVEYKIVSRGVIKVIMVIMVIMVTSSSDLTRPETGA